MSLEGLVVLFLRECELLDASSGPALRLFGLHQTILLFINLGLEVLDLLHKPRVDLPPSRHGLHLVLEGTAVRLAVLGVLLFGLVFSNAALTQDLLQISL